MGAYFLYIIRHGFSWCSLIRALYPGILSFVILVFIGFFSSLLEVFMLRIQLERTDIESIVIYVKYVIIYGLFFKYCNLLAGDILVFKVVVKH